MLYLIGEINQLINLALLSDFIFQHLEYIPTLGIYSNHVSQHSVGSKQLDRIVYSASRVGKWRESPMQSHCIQMEKVGW